MNDIKRDIKKAGYRGTPAQCRFVMFYTDPSSDCFMSRKKAAKRAKVKGSKALFRVLMRVCDERINKDADLIPHRVKAKIFELMEAKTTKFFQSEGVVIERHDIEDNGTQLKATKLAMEAYRIGADDEGKGGKEIFLIDAAFPDDPSPLPGVEPVDLSRFAETEENEETDW